MNTTRMNKAQHQIETIRIRTTANDIAVALAKIEKSIYECEELVPGHVMASLMNARYALKTASMHSSNAHRDMKEAGPSQ